MAKTGSDQAVCLLDIVFDARPVVALDDQSLVVGCRCISTRRLSVCAPTPSFQDSVRGKASGLPVVAHAEGRGEAIRAARLGARYLAHAPFTDVLNASDIAELARSVIWISTLDIHGWGAYDDDFAVAVENVRRFHEADGLVRYGTDMGNGPTPVGLLNIRELDALLTAGLTGFEIMSAMTPGDPLRADADLVIIPGAHLDCIDPTSAHFLTMDDVQDLT